MPDGVNIIHIGRRGKQIFVQIMPLEVYERRIEIEEIQGQGPGTAAMFPVDERTASISMEVEAFGAWFDQVVRWWEQMKIDKPWET